MAYRIDYLGRADTWERTPQGGLLAKGNLTRTGVLLYQNEDGTIRRELRHPDEVFAPASLSTLRAAPLTERHPSTTNAASGQVNADNWSSLAVGHVGEDVSAQGTFVTATVRVQSARIAKAVQDGALKEFSCGYTCTLDMTPGEYNGEKYDGIQREIRYNHVGIGPVGWGRAGSDVAIRADGVSYYARMTLEEALAALATEKATNAALSKRNDELQGRLDSAVSRADAAEKRAPNEADISARVDAKMALLGSVREVLGDKAPATGSDRDLQVAVILSESPEFKADGRSEDYVRARFDAIVENVRAARKANGDVRTDANAAQTQTPTTGADDARKRMIERNANAWKPATKAGN